MFIRSRSLLVKTICLVLTIAFTALDIAWAHPDRLEPQHATLATPALTQADAINERTARLRDSLCAETNALAALHNIGKCLFGDPATGFNLGGEERLDEYLTVRLGSDRLAGFDLTRVVFKDGIAFIPYEKDNDHFTIQMALRNGMRQHELLGYDWFFSDRYVVAVLPEDYTVDARVKPAADRAPARQPRMQVGEPVTVEVPDATPEEAPAQRTTRITLRRISALAASLMFVAKAAFPQEIVETLTENADALPGYYKLIPIILWSCIGILLFLSAFRFIFTTQWYLYRLSRDRASPGVYKRGEAYLVKKDVSPALLMAWLRPKDAARILIKIKLKKLGKAISSESINAVVDRAAAALTSAGDFEVVYIESSGGIIETGPSLEIRYPGTGRAVAAEPKGAPGAAAKARGPRGGGIGRVIVFLAAMLAAGSAAAQTSETFSLAAGLKDVFLAPGMIALYIGIAIGISLALYFALKPVRRSFVAVAGEPVIAASILDVPPDEVPAKAKAAIEAGRRHGTKVIVHYDVIDANGGAGTDVVQKGARHTADLLTPAKARIVADTLGKDGVLDVHLMLPGEKVTERLIRQYINSGAGIVTLHWESFTDKALLLERLHYIRSRGVMAGLAVNPDVAIASAGEFIRVNRKGVDMFLQMSVFPGLGNQKFIPEVLGNIERIKGEFGYDGLIEIDGGINPETIKEAWRSGVDLFVAGGAVFKKDAKGKITDPLIDEACGKLAASLDTVLGAASAEARAAYRYIGISMGGNKLAVSLNDGNNAIIGAVKELRWDDDERFRNGKIKMTESAAAVMDEVTSRIVALLRENGVDPADIHVVNASLAGPLDKQNGIFGSDFKTPNLPFNRFPFRAELARQLAAAGITARIEMGNDGECARNGERYSPVGKLQGKAGGIVIIGGGINISVDDESVKEAGHNLYQVRGADGQVHYTWVGHLTGGRHPIELGVAEEEIIAKSGAMGQEFVALGGETAFREKYPDYPFIERYKGLVDFEDSLSGPNIRARVAAIIARAEEEPEKAQELEYCRAIRTRAEALGRPGEFECALTPEAAAGNPEAAAAIKSVAREVGMALAAFLAAYHDRDFAENLVLVSGVNENMGRGVYSDGAAKRRGLDIYMEEIRETARDEMVSRFGVAPGRAAALANGIVRSEMAYERELTAYQPTDEEVLAVYRKKTALKRLEHRAAIAANLAKNERKGFGLTVVAGVPFGEEGPHQEFTFATIVERIRAKVKDITGGSVAFDQAEGISATHMTLQALARTKNFDEGDTFSMEEALAGIRASVAAANARLAKQPANINGRMVVDLTTGIDEIARISGRFKVAITALHYNEMTGEMDLTVEPIEASREAMAELQRLFTLISPEAPIRRFHINLGRVTRLLSAEQAAAMHHLDKELNLHRIPPFTIGTLKAVLYGTRGLTDVVAAKAIRLGEEGQDVDFNALFAAAEERIADVGRAKPWPVWSETPKEKRTLVLVSGGDCAGLNSFIGSLAEESRKVGGAVAGVRNGLEGLLREDFAGSLIPVDEKTAGDMPFWSSVEFGSTRKSLAEGTPETERAIANIVETCGAVVVVGGNDHLNEAEKLTALLKEKGVTVIAVPKTIDNDTLNTTALGVASAEAIAREETYRAAALPGSNRCVVVEVMGRNMGSLAVAAANRSLEDSEDLSQPLREKIIAAGPAVMTLVPEYPIPIAAIRDQARARMEHYGAVTVVAAEGFRVSQEDPEYETIIARNPVLAAALRNVKLDAHQNVIIPQGIAAEFIAEILSEYRPEVEVLGFTPRGTIPTERERRLAREFARLAARAIAARRTGMGIAVSDLAGDAERGKVRLVEIGHIAGRSESGKSLAKTLDQIAAPETLVRSGVIIRPDQPLDSSRSVPSFSVPVQPKEPLAVAKAVLATCKSAWAHKRPSIICIAGPDAGTVVSGLNEEMSLLTDTGLAHDYALTQSSIIFLHGARPRPLNDIVREAYETNKAYGSVNIVAAGDFRIARNDPLLPVLRAKSEELDRRIAAVEARSDGSDDLVFSSAMKEIGQVLKLVMLTADVPVENTKRMSDVRLTALDTALATFTVPGVFDETTKAVAGRASVRPAGASYDKRLVDNNPETVQYGLTAVMGLPMNGAFIQGMQAIQAAIAGVVGSEHVSFYGPEHTHATLASMIRSQAAPVTSLTYTVQKKPEEGGGTGTKTIDLERAADIASITRPFSITFDRVSINDAGEILLMGSGDRTMGLQTIRQALCRDANFAGRPEDQKNEVHTMIGYLTGLRGLSAEERHTLAAAINETLKNLGETVATIEIDRIRLVHYGHRSLRRLAAGAITLTLGVTNAGVKPEIGRRLLETRSAAATGRIAEIRDLVASAANNAKAHAVDGCNALEEAVLAHQGKGEEALARKDLSRRSSADDVAERVETVLRTAAALPQGTLSGADADIAETLQETAYRLDAQTTLADFIAWAKAADERGQKVVFGLSKGWIPGGIQGPEGVHPNTLNPLVNEILSIPAELAKIGLKNVETVETDGDDLAAKILARVAELRKQGYDVPLANVAALDSMAAITSAAYDSLRSIPGERRAVLAGINPAELERCYRETRGTSLLPRIRILKMVRITIGVAAGKKPPKTPLVDSYDEENRIIIFLPGAEPVDYEILQDIYRAEKDALAAA